MRIAYLSDSLPPLTDGVTRTLEQLFTSLLAEGVEFRVYSAFQPPAGTAWRDRVRRLRSLSFPGYREYRCALPWGQGLARDLDRFGPDLVHVVSPTLLGHFGQRWARRRRKPVVASYHTHFLSYLPHYGARRLRGPLLRVLRAFHARCARTYAPSPSAARLLQGWGLAGVELWPRGVDTDAFSPALRSAALRAAVVPDERPLVLCVGRLVREKDLDDLAAAHEILRGREVPFRLAFVGQGPHQAALQARLPEAFFAGHQSGDALARWYASADVFACPSSTETFGNVALEALASGLPVVGVDQGGVADLVRAGVDGLIARAHDPSSLADALGALLADPCRRRALGRAGRAAAEARRWPDVNRALLRSYERVIAEGVLAGPAPRRPPLRLTSLGRLGPAKPR